jgi:hypothetical protein
VLHARIPEHIHITDNVMIPLKERVVDRLSPGDATASHGHGLVTA